MRDQRFRRFPPLNYCARLWGRGVVIYAVLRSVAVAASAGLDKAIGATAVGSKPGLSLPSLVAIFAVSVFLVSLSARRRRETPLLQSLGVDPKLTYAVALSPAALFELIVWIA